MRTRFADLVSAALKGGGDSFDGNNAMDALEVYLYDGVHDGVIRDIELSNDLHAAILTRYPDFDLARAKREAYSSKPDYSPSKVEPLSMAIFVGFSLGYGDLFPNPKERAVLYRAIVDDTVAMLSTTPDVEKRPGWVRIHPLAWSNFNRVGFESGVDWLNDEVVRLERENP